jgi:hypothetical protein
MAVRGDIVDYTIARLVDVLEQDGIWRPQIGYLTLPAIVIAETTTDVLDLYVLGEAWEFGANSLVVRGVAKGPAAPDTRKGSRVDPTARPGQPGTWSVR